MVEMSVDMTEVPVKAAEPNRPAGLLQQNRAFLDFFWDLAKPDQAVRLKAVEDLVRYLKTQNQADELEYTFNKLVNGLGHTRETARPGFSLALGQVLSSFEDVSLQSVLDRIKRQHSLQEVKKKFARKAMFGNLFGVLALQQSGRLTKEPLVVLGCVQLLQSLSQYKQHLKDLPTKTMLDILNEIPEEVFEELLLGALQADLASAFSTPEQLQLLLVALQRFPHTLKPKKLKKLLGSSTIINEDNIPRLTEVLKVAAHSTKKDLALPAVALDLLKLSLREDSFQLFWSKAIIDGMLKEPPGPTHYLSFRLLGSALPLLSLPQLREVLSGEVMVHYGEHVLSAQKPDRFKLAPEMETLVADFLQGCEDSEKQLAVMVGFSSLSNRGYPVVPSVWKVAQHLQPAALRDYVDWLKSMFLQPQMNELLDFVTRRQKDEQEERERKESPVVRLRRWIVARLSSIISSQAKTTEELVMDVARFLFFHAFFTTKKVSPAIAETKGTLSVALGEKTRGDLANAFFGVLMSLHHKSSGDHDVGQKRVQGVTADGTMWIYHLVQYAQLLFSQSKHVQSVRPFGPEERRAWDSMLESVANLKKEAKKGSTAGNNAFLHLFLLVGILLFKVQQDPEELLDIMKDLQSCMDKAQEKKKAKKKKQTTEQEPEWVEVMVDILLSLLSRQSRHIRQVCKTVFSSICPHVNAAALTAILDVLDPDKEDEEDGAVVVTDDAGKTQKKKLQEAVDEDMEDDESEESDEDENGEDEEEEEEGEEDMEQEEVDQNFRLELMKVLQQQNALATEGDGSSDEDLDDDAMMELDKSLAALFTEQKKKSQAKKDEKMKLKKEKTLVREFKIKVLDLVEVFVARQAGSPLVLGLVEPLLNIINRGMRSGSDQQEQEFLRRAADIFRNGLCRSKVYCRTAGDRQGELHDLLEKLMTKCQKLSDSSVGLYYFSAAMYLVKVLRGAVPTETDETQTAGGAATADPKFMGTVDVDRVSRVFTEALGSFMSRRKSPLTAQMFVDLFNRFPVLCVNLLDTAVRYISSGLRHHQKGQACVLVLRAMQSREVQQLLSGDRWTKLCEKVSEQLAGIFGQVDQNEINTAREKLLKALDLCQFVVKHVCQQKLVVDLELLQKVLQSLVGVVDFKKTGKLEDTYWAVMKHFGVTKPKVIKTKPDAEPDQPPALKKKKGFLPETKKRKKRNKPVLEPASADKPASADEPEAEKGQTKKKTTRKRPVDGAPGSSPPKKTKTQSDSKAAKKKKKKKPKQKEGGEQV